jgi:hypothetical protein
VVITLVNEQHLDRLAVQLSGAGEAAEPRADDKHTRPPARKCLFDPLRVSRH